MYKLQKREVLGVLLSQVCGAQNAALQKCQRPTRGILCRDIIVELNVGKGDTLESLAEMFRLPYEKVLAANEGARTQAIP